MSDDESDPVLSSWKNHEAGQGQGKSSSVKFADPPSGDALKKMYEEDTNPQRAWLHANMTTVSFFVVLALLLMISDQILCFVFDDVGKVDIVIRSYIILLCLLGIFVEFEWTKVARSKILRWWVTRGIFYAFIGVLEMQQNENRRLRSIQWTGDHAEVSLNFVEVMPWIMISVGGFYFSLGSLCIQFCYSRQREEFEKRKEQAKTIKAASKRYGFKPDIV